MLGGGRGIVLLGTGVRSVSQESPPSNVLDLEMKSVRLFVSEEGPEYQGRAAVGPIPLCPELILDLCPVINE